MAALRNLVSRLGRLRIPHTNRRTFQTSRSYHTPSASAQLKELLHVSDDVQDAIASGKPVVALESTIYTHGFPYPDNVALASRLESVVRLAGGVPATIGVLNGILKVGLGAEELIELASSSQKGKVMKVSRRDLGYICGLGLNGKGMYGGTTVAGTMVLAHLAGIKVFATGGLGGVHRGGENSMDISADLTELGRTPVAVVSSGCKSFLDIPRTLEYLETEGVLVGTFADGRQGSIDFPAFYTRESGIKAQRVIEDEAEAAAIIFAQNALRLSSGLLFANPVPSEYSLLKDEMDAIISQAIELAEAQGAHGSDNTPFVLAKIKELTGGRSVIANRALVEANVKCGTKVAVELAKLEKEQGTVGGDRHMPGAIGTFKEPSEPASIKDDMGDPVSPAELYSAPEILEKASVLVAGSLAIDFTCDYTPYTQKQGIKADHSPTLHTSNPSAIHQTLGGVGHNVALAASYMGSSVLFCSVVADDLSGRAALSALTKSSLRPQGIQVLGPTTGARTAQYVAINDSKKDLMLAMADMSILDTSDSHFDFTGFWEPLVHRTQPNWTVLDTNWSPQALSKWASLAKKHGSKIALEPVSTAKAERLFSHKHGSKPVIGPSNAVPHNSIDLATPNRYELAAMYTVARETGLFESAEWWRIINSLEMPSSGSRNRLISITTPELVDEGIPQQSIQLLPFMPCIVTKLGAQGLLLTQLLRPGDERLRAADYAPYIVGRAAVDTSADVGGVYVRLFPPAETLTDDVMVSVNGAGDTLLGVIVAGLSSPTAGADEHLRRLETILPVAQRASVMTLKSSNAVSESITDLAGLLRST
ncbi:hypothetical protein AJ80_08112 [Polytolypa hystricis UAMH7299]|uniref:Carbohydrate kinase PfkB domain-containing protein n=1 Tax=Polytolypa hystricis (strain UAMH7299) TaxID=1447883 RepID=A0A2B7XD44_POLH7|nr:hypothetical protein AJ80_08112 [Polytolypa hystricis UAMH7299]